MKTQWIQLYYWNRRHHQNSLANGCIECRFAATFQWIPNFPFLSRHILFQFQAPDFVRNASTRDSWSHVVPCTFLQTQKLCLRCTLIRWCISHDACIILPVAEENKRYQFDHHYWMHARAQRAPNVRLLLLLSPVLVRPHKRLLKVHATYGNIAHMIRFAGNISHIERN